MRVFHHAALGLFLAAFTSCGGEPAGETKTDAQTGETQKTPGDNPSGDTPAELDRNDPRSVARSVLAAYQAKDAGKLAELSGRAKVNAFHDIAAGGESHPLYADEFGGPWWESARDWDGNFDLAGELGIVRYRNGPPVAAIVPFDVRQGVVFVVELARENGDWVFQTREDHEPAELRELDERIPK